MAPSVISSLLLVHPLEVTWFPSPIKERLGRTVSSQDHERAHARGHRIRELLYAVGFTWELFAGINLRASATVLSQYALLLALAVMSKHPLGELS